MMEQSWKETWWSCWGGLFSTSNLLTPSTGVEHCASVREGSSPAWGWDDIGQSLVGVWKNCLCFLLHPKKYTPQKIKGMLWKHRGKKSCCIAVLIWTWSETEGRVWRHSENQSEKIVQQVSPLCRNFIAAAQNYTHKIILIIILSAAPTCFYAWRGAIMS